MSVLSRNERDALEDIFLSIHHSSNKYQKIKQISSWLIKQNPKLHFSKLIIEAKHGLKECKIIYFLVDLGKKKKKLSK